MSQHVPPWVYPVWDSVRFLDLSAFFLMLGKFSAIISSNIFSGSFSSPSGTPIMQMLLHYNIYKSQRSLRLSSFLLILFSLFCSVAVISITFVFQLTYSIILPQLFCYWFLLMYFSHFPSISVVKNLPAIQETWVQSLGREDPLEKEMVTHFSILAWEIP